MKQKKQITLRARLDKPTLNKLAIAFAIVILATVTYLHYLAPHTLEAKQRVELESIQSQLIETKRSLNHQRTLDAKQDAEKQRQLEEVQIKLKETQEALQAKRSTPESSTAYAEESSPPAYTGGGDKNTWMAAAGIPQSEWWAVDSIVSRESGWNPNAVNVSSGACGLGQQLPCGKWAGAWNDPVAALIAQYGYVIERYGGYAQAVEFWNINHWY